MLFEHPCLDIFFVRLCEPLQHRETFTIFYVIDGRAHGKYHNAHKASAGRLENWQGIATHFSFTGKSIEDDVVGLAETNRSIPARVISHRRFQYPKFAQVGRRFASQAGATDKGAADGSEDEFSELEPTADSAEAHADPYLSEADFNKEEVHNASPLYQTVLSCKDYELPSSLEQWLADGNVLTRGEVIITFVHICKRHRFRRLLKVSLLNVYQVLIVNHLWLSCFCYATLLFSVTHWTNVIQGLSQHKLVIKMVKGYVLHL